MNKPRTKREEKRKLIIAAATDLFSELGFAQTSMDKIAKKAGVSKQTVYSHFGSKDELFGGAISRKCISHNLRGLVNEKLGRKNKELGVSVFGFKVKTCSALA